MSPEELEVKKFELEQKVKLEELALRKKELDLRMQEQKSKRVATPIILSIVGGLLTLITGIVINHFDSKAQIALEDKKFQSSLLLKAAESESYEEFSNMLMAFQQNDLLTIDSSKLAEIRKKRLLTEDLDKLVEDDSLEVAAVSEPVVSPDPAPSTTPNPAAKPNTKTRVNTSKITRKERTFVWTIVAGADTDLKSAKYEKSRAEKYGFKNVGIWYRNRSYRTCIGRYNYDSDALKMLFEVKEKMNGDAYIVRLNTWCPNPVWDERRKIYNCK
ncbi:SPOR domain-containing protein [Sungkyunkwania multivorans]|uniref:SPOR domain-containing protein n=1 Tax=Sungkyunkwania multivorans TaxID=1173618 RepID=A0ABW3CVJ4_9FLAO